MGFNALLQPCAFGFDFCASRIPTNTCCICWCSRASTSTPMATREKWPDRRSVWSIWSVSCRSR